LIKIINADHNNFSSKYWYLVVLCRMTTDVAPYDTYMTESLV